MGGLFSDSPTASTDPILGNLRVQTSLYGLTRAVGYGRNRQQGNLVWFGDFKSVPHEERSETGKGGGGQPVRTSYTYTASVIMALGEGPVQGVRTTWIGKEKFAAIAQGQRPIQVTESLPVPASGPYTVTVGHAAAFLIPVSVLVYGYLPVAEGFSLVPDRPLFEGRDFTRAGGVYTFDASLAGQLVQISYQYETSVDAASSLAQLGLSLKPGTPDQAVWPYLTANHPTEALGYSSLAYIYAQDYALDNSAQVPNHNFECDYQLQFSPTIPDADPAAVCTDILLNTRYGVGFASGNKADWTAFSNYCVASGLFISPVYSDQRPARDVLGEIIEACNADACWTGEQLEIVPRGDASITANGVTYTPDNTPLYVVGPDDFLPTNAGLPVDVAITDPADRNNVVKIEFSNRANDYNIEAVSWSDEAAIAMYGLRPAQTKSWRVFTTSEVTMQAAQILLQREQAALATYKFSLPWQFIGIRPGKLLSLNEPKLGMVGTIVKVLELAEGADDSLVIVAQEFPIGHANAPLYQPQLASGFRPEMNIAAGDVTTPMFFEPPGSSADGSSGLEVWIAVSSDSPSWGGCDVYASLDDGSSYKLVGRAENGARYGALTAGLAAGSTSVLNLHLAGRGGKLFSTSPADADGLATLCYVGDTATGEWLAYESATLTGTNAYALTGLRRGRYGSSDGSIASGAKFAFIDGAIIMSGALQTSMVGKAIKFKFASFNIFGGGLQPLSDAPEYSYTVSGRFMGQTGRPINVNDCVNSTFAFGTAQWAPTGIALPVGLEPGMTDPVDFLRSLDPAQRVPGVPSSALLFQNGSQAKYSYVDSQPRPVSPGGRYYAMARLLPVRCTAAIFLVFLDAAGLVAGFVPTTTVPNLAGHNPTNPDEHAFAGVFAVAPPTAVSRILRLVSFGTVAGETSSGVYIHEPAMGPARAEQTEFPVYSMGGQNSVGTAQIELNATTKPITEDFVCDYNFLYAAAFTEVTTRRVAVISFIPEFSGLAEVTAVITAVLATGTYAQAQISFAGSKPLWAKTTTMNAAPQAATEPARPFLARSSGVVSGSITITQTVTVVAGQPYDIGVTVSGDADWPIVSGLESYVRDAHVRITQLIR